MLGSSFQIGRSALTAYQAALSVTGQNIANIANPDYVRQRGRLSAEIGGEQLGIRPGGGVRLTELQRRVDEALESRLRLAGGTRIGQQTIALTLSRTESLYAELTEGDVSTQLAELFGAFAQLQTSPTDTTNRNLVLYSADRVIASLHRQRDGLLQQVRDLNDDAKPAAQRASDLAAQIADLNAHIVAAEGGGVRIASALRDQRDGALRQLSELVDIQTRPQPSGAVNVYIGSQPLVEFDRSRGLRIETVLEDGLELSKVRFADDNAGVILRGGQLHGLVTARDTHIRSQLAGLDQLARGLIYETNRIHSGGTGTSAHTIMTSNYAVDDVRAALNSSAAGLDFPVGNGTFLLKVRDQASGQITTRLIEVDLDGLGGNDTSLESLTAALNAAPGVSARISADRRLQITAGAGQEFWFAEDESGALAALGLGSFFSGTNAGNIDIDARIRADVGKIATSATGAPNDGTLAGEIARLAGDARTSTLTDGMSLSAFHASLVGKLAVQAGGALAAADAADSIFAGLTAQRESISGVSLDEEAINLTQYERAYQGAARFMGVLQNMTSELLSIMR